MTTKVIHLKKETETQEFLKKLYDLVGSGEVTDLVVMARYKDKTSEYSWFGDDSSFKCLGMATYMVNRIDDYITENEVEV
jgi:hypothetical protein